MPKIIIRQHIPLRMQSQLAKTLFLLIFVCLAISHVFAAVHAVVPTCGNNGDGTNWTCAASSGGAGAYNAIPANLVRGDIYYLADGSYPAYTFSTAASGTATVEIRKAQSYDFGGLSGWNTSTMGSSQAIFQQPSPPSFTVAASYLVLNGNGKQTSPGCGVSVGASPTSEPTTPSDCGIRIDNTRCTSSTGDACDNPMHVNGGVTNFTVEYLELVGNGVNNSERSFFGLYGGGGTSNQYFTGSHLFGRNAGCVYFVWTSNNWSVKYSYFCLQHKPPANRAGVRGSFVLLAEEAGHRETRIL